MITAISDRN
jgi:hypothetical protein